MKVEQDFATEGAKGPFGVELDHLAKEIEETFSMFYRLRTKLFPLRVDQMPQPANEPVELEPTSEVQGSPHGRQLNEAVRQVRALRKEIEDLWDKVIV